LQLRHEGELDVEVERPIEEARRDPVPEAHQTDEQEHDEHGDAHRERHPAPDPAEQREHTEQHEHVERRDEVPERRLGAGVTRVDDGVEVEE
jgi:hypothetical protein